MEPSTTMKFLLPLVFTPVTVFTRSAGEGILSPLHPRGAAQDRHCLEFPRMASGPACADGGPMRRVACYASG